MSKDNRIVSPAPSSTSSLAPTTPDESLRPLTFEEFTGQGQGLDNMKAFINAAHKRSEAMDHVLLHGPPGLGKTTLARIIANELGIGFRGTSGPVIAKAGDLAALLTNLQPVMSFSLMRFIVSIRLSKRCFIRQWKIFSWI